MINYTKVSTIARQIQQIEEIHEQKCIANPKARACGNLQPKEEQNPEKQSPSAMTLSANEKLSSHFNNNREKLSHRRLFAEHPFNQ